jgi:hypothetical protein
LVFVTKLQHSVLTGGHIRCSAEMFPLLPHIILRRYTAVDHQAVPEQHRTSGS